MKHTNITLLLLVLLSLPMVAQKQSISIHPAVGDTISQHEKVLYLLFPEMPDSTFKYAVVHKNAEEYFVDSYSSTQKPQSSLIDSTDIQAYRNNIDKLLIYYAKLDDTNTQSIMNNGQSSMKVNEAYMAMSPAMKEDFLRNAKRYKWLKMQAQEKGLFGRELDQWVQSQGFWASDGSKKKKDKKKKKHALTPNGVTIN